MALNPGFDPTLTQGGFIGTSILRGRPETKTPVSIIKVGKQDIKLDKSELRRTRVTKVRGKKRKSKLGPYGWYLF